MIKEREERNMREWPKSYAAKSDAWSIVRRSSYEVSALFVLTLLGAWSVYHYQFEVLPQPLTLEQVGKGGFSEDEALKHVAALTQNGPHPVVSDALERALEHVLTASEAIRKTAPWDVDVEVDSFHAKSGVNRQSGGRYAGKTLVYSDLHHVVMRISPKNASEARENASEARENAILVSAHIDTVFSAPGAGDDSSSAAVMLELARGISQSAHEFKHAVIFLFNTGEEEGLDGSSSFITQHPWSHTLRVAIDMEAMGIGGKSSIFQAGPDPWAVENFAKVAKYPSGQIAAQDVFSSGIIQSSTDFQIYREVAGLSGLDFVYTEHTAVYHTKNDKLELLKPGSLQHLGDNMLPFLLQAATSTDFPSGKIMESDHNSDGETPIYFDILGTYMIVFRQSFAKMLYNSVIILSALIWAASLLLGGFSAVTSFVLSCLTLIFMWIGSITLAGLVAFLIPSICSTPVPFVSTPWLVLGLFGSPALLGALLGQHVGYLLLRSYLSSTYSERKCNLSSAVQVPIPEVDSERWIFKAGLLQWLIVLIVGNYYEVGSTYLALVWLASPAIAYGLLEATLSPEGLSRPLKTLTLLVGLFLPFLLTSGLVIQLMGVIVGTSVRLDSNPGSSPVWLIDIAIALVAAAVVCLTLVYHLSYVHNSGAKVPIILATLVLFGLSIGAVLVGLFPAFTEDTGRAVHVVHVVDAGGVVAGEQGPQSFISMFSTTPGNLNKEAEQIGGLVCGKEKQFDFITFTVYYGCWSEKEVEIDWEEFYIPEFHVEGDTYKETRITEVSLDTKISTRWVLGINYEEIEDFELRDDYEELVSSGGNTSIDGWHIIQFAGGKNASTKFYLKLFWLKNRSHDDTKTEHLLKLRTDVNIVTEQAAQVIAKLPPGYSPYGKSINPYHLAYFNSLPVAFEVTNHNLVQVPSTTAAFIGTS